MENLHFHGKINYFYGHSPVSKLLVITRGYIKDLIIIHRHESPSLTIVNHGSLRFITITLW